MTAPVEASARQARWTADNLDHLVCCDENVALCGADVSDAFWSDDLPDLCVVCRDIDDRDEDCPRCEP